MILIPCHKRWYRFLALSPIHNRIDIVDWSKQIIVTVVELNSIAFASFYKCLFGTDILHHSVLFEFEALRSINNNHL